MYFQFEHAWGELLQLQQKVVLERNIPVASIGTMLTNASTLYHGSFYSTQEVRSRIPRISFMFLEYKHVIRIFELPKIKKD